MIDDNEEGYGGFTLSCDLCGSECEEFFEDFMDAVAYKKDRDNKWASVKDKNGDWLELCPSCNTPDIVADLKGIKRTGHTEISKNAADVKHLADLASQGLEDF